MLHRFHATLDIIGGNPFVEVPEAILEGIFAAAGKASGPIPVTVGLFGAVHKQTLVRYCGMWRLYINMVMLPDSPRRIGEALSLGIAYDPADRSIPMPQELDAALAADPAARMIFESLRPSLRKEIMRYIGGLKSAEAVARNVRRAIAFLHGRERFVGRDTIHD